MATPNSGIGSGSGPFSFHPNMLPLAPPFGPQPIVVKTGEPCSQQKGGGSKNEFLEMMMMQNAQMHQMVMQQAMLTSVNKQMWHQASGAAAQPAPPSSTAQPSTPKVIHISSGTKEKSKKKCVCEKGACPLHASFHHHHPCTQHSHHHGHRPPSLPPCAPHHHPPQIHNHPPLPAIATGHCQQPNQPQPAAPPPSLPPPPPPPPPQPTTLILNNQPPAPPPAPAPAPPVQPIIEMIQPEVAQQQPILIAAAEQERNNLPVEPPLPALNGYSDAHPVMPARSKSDNQRAKHRRLTQFSSPVQKKLRLLFYIIWFNAYLRLLVRKGKRTIDVPKEPFCEFYFAIQIKEVIATLHNFYLHPNGKILGMLQKLLLPGAVDLTTAAQGNHEAIDMLRKYTSALVEHITAIMPISGVLGTRRGSGVHAMLRSGQLYPRAYFWAVEKNQLTLTADGRTANVSSAQAQMLLTGVFFGRAVIRTLCQKPVEYGLSRTTPGGIGTKNLRLIATLLLAVYRATARPRGLDGAPMGYPRELVDCTYDDVLMGPIFNALARTISLAEARTREWSSTYVRRLGDL